MREPSSYPPVQTAILLCAGRGTRLGALTAGGPKCLVPLHGEPLLAHQVRALRAVGITRVVMVVGHDAFRLCSQARALAPDLQWHFVLAPDYAESNTLWSLAEASAFLECGALLINGDVLFGPDLIAHLIQNAGPGGVAVEVGRCGAEEVKVLVGDDDRVLALSKRVPSGDALGESVGISLFRPAWGHRLAACLRAMHGDESTRHAYYEAAVARVSVDVPLRAVRLEGHPVIEIDFLEDFERARDEIAPRLMEAV